MQKRYRDHENSSQVAGILAPTTHAPLPRDYHRENMIKMQQKQELVQQKMNE